LKRNQTNFQKDRNPFLTLLDELRNGFWISSTSRSNSTHTTINLSPTIAAKEATSSDISPTILAKDDTPFDWNSLHSKFPWEVTDNNWDDLRQHFPAEIRSNFQLNYSTQGRKVSPTITFRPPRAAKRPPIPLEIKGYPVIIPAPTLLSRSPGSNPPTDPRIDNPINPSLALDDDTVKEILQTYNFALGFYIFLDGSIQIIVPRDCNVQS
jgi:hypothetical protein